MCNCIRLRQAFLYQQRLKCTTAITRNMSLCLCVARDSCCILFEQPDPAFSQLFIAKYSVYWRLNHIPSQGIDNLSLSNTQLMHNYVVTGPI